jgi:tetratricopeptide (TPR) repeat protein
VGSTRQLKTTSTQPQTTHPNPSFPRRREPRFGWWGFEFCSDEHAHGGRHRRTTLLTLGDGIAQLLHLHLLLLQQPQPRPHGLTGKGETAFFDLDLRGNLTELFEVGVYCASAIQQFQSGTDASIVKMTETWEALVSEQFRFSTGKVSSIMAKRMWCQNEDWNDTIEAEFMAKLKKSTSKAESLRVQSVWLEKKYPEVSARLWRMYFETGKLSKRSENLVEQAKTYIANARFDDAAKLFEEAVEIEANRHNYINDIRYYYALFVARHGLSTHYKNVDRLCNYGEAITLLQKFMRRASQALIAHKLNELESAKKHAGIALWFVEQKDFEASMVNVDDEFAQDLDRLKFITESRQMN